ncbi:hypothetical protein KAI78_05850 [bacterium]|nr:hypothetical protein [bacterium]
MRKHSVLLILFLISGILISSSGNEIYRLTLTDGRALYGEILRFEWKEYFDLGLLSGKEMMVPYASVTSVELLENATEPVKVLKNMIRSDFNRKLINVQFALALESYFRDIGCIMAGFEKILLIHKAGYLYLGSRVFFSPENEYLFDAFLGLKFFNPFKKSNVFLSINCGPYYSGDYPNRDNIEAQFSVEIGAISFNERYGSIQFSLFKTFRVVRTRHMDPWGDEYYERDILGGFGLSMLFGF